MELVILTPEEQFLKAIEWNHEQIKNELAVRLEKYKGLTYSDDQIKEAKSDRATLNKFKTAIEDKRKEIKKTCLTPYEVFESKVKEILALVDEPINEIDVQVKAYEEKQKDEKKLVIEGVYQELIGDMKEILPLAKLWNEKWLNTTYKLSNVTEEISMAIDKVRNDLQVIDTIEGEYTLQVKDKFLQTLDLSVALKEKTRLEEQAKKIKEFDREQHQKKMAEAEKIIQAEKERQAKVDAMKQNQNINPVPAQEVILPQPVAAEVKVEVEEQLEQIDFRVWVTKEQKQALKQFLIETKIKYGKVC
jgi:hypothetical protein